MTGSIKRKTAIVLFVTLIMVGVTVGVYYGVEGHKSAKTGIPTSLMLVAAIIGIVNSTISAVGTTIGVS